MSKGKVFAIITLVSILFAVLASCTKQNTGQDELISHEETALEESEDAEELSAVDFNLQDQYGKFHSLSEYRGKNVMLVFWATWCPDCMEELPDIEKLYREYNEDLVILGVNTPNIEPETDAGKIADFMEENNYTFTTLMDEGGKVFEAYRIRTYPTTYFIDPDGEIKECVKEIMHYEDMKKSMEQNFK